MLINSLQGIFSIVISETNPDKLEVRSNDKASLSRVFDNKRILERANVDFKFYVSISKQEFANTLIMMIKEIDYPDFDKLLSEIDSSRGRFLA